MTTPKPPTPQPPEPQTPVPQTPVPHGPSSGPQSTPSARTDTSAAAPPQPQTPGTEASVGAETPGPSSAASPTAASSPASTPSSATETTTSTEEPPPDPDRPKDPGPAALFDALAAEHAAIYGYGLVSAHVMPDDNELVSESLAQHRDRRESVLALMNDRSLKAPMPAAGYQLPMVVNNATNAAKLAVRMEGDCAVAWRAVLEQTDSDQDRAFGTNALTQCAVLAARWREVLGAWPITQAFPGGSE